MSTRDQSLVNSIGVPVAQMAIAMSKSRQTVNRGIGGDDDYFKPVDLVRALEYWRASDPNLFSLARQKICELYPEFAAAVIEAAGGAPAGEFSTDSPGEYWFLCADFIAFRNSLPSCMQQLEALCASPLVSMSIFVDGRDQQALLAISKLKGRSEDSNENRIVAVPCDNRILNGMLRTLLRIQDDGTMELFAARDEGFVALSGQEAARLRNFVQDNFLENSDVLEGAEAD